MIRKALTIAGLDSGGGAGIIADLKTFSALGVWGMAALTSITAQNTRAVLGIQDVSAEMINLQIKAVVEDIGVDAAKTGMLHTKEIIETVAETVSSYNLPLVVDPVMISKSGALLIKEEAIESLKKKILPIAKIVTPNIPEAEKLSGIRIKNVEDMKKAAKYIVENLGCESVVVKGGHLDGKKSVDILYWEREYAYFESPRIYTKNTHGTGCTYSAAITAEIAKGKRIIDAVKTAKEFIHIAILYGLSLGSGHGPVNHMAWLYREAERYTVINELKKALRLIESMYKASSLIPEVGMNIAFAVRHAVDKKDVAAIPGRIRNAMGIPKACCEPEFNASKHLASY
ncbi:MAG: bifunctional hydroxymethylpyrimidine kinase/phosphomethylpyrimidine kinase, partial [Candidatus Njordarchaeota archaeon]